MEGKWIKIVLFVLGVIMLAGVANVLLDPGLGTPDNSRRWKHPAGFSIVAPLRWDATISYDRSGINDQIRLTPVRSTGRGTTIHVTRSPEKPTIPAAAVTREITFQDQPAQQWARQLRYEWLWQLQFERDGAWYQIMLSSPIEIDVEGGQFMPYINSFRIEPRVQLPPLPTAGQTSPDAPSTTLPTMPVPTPTH